jgi:hypothetical protein
MVSNPRRSSVRTHGVPRDQNRENFRANPPPDTSSKTWGDSPIIPKPASTFRYTFINIQTLPVDPHHHKHQQIGTAIQETESDTLGFVEHNLNFRVLRPTEQWSERFRQLPRNHSIHTYNRHDTTQKRILFGGAAQISTGACSHRATESGADESGMGRWVWTLFAGQNHTTL